MAENGLTELKSKRTPKRKSFPDEDYVIPKKLSHKKKTVINKLKETANTQSNLIKTETKTKKTYVDSSLKTKKKVISTSSKQQTKDKKHHNNKNSSEKISPVKLVTNNNPLKKCPKATCKSLRPVCFANGSKSCSGDGYTARWYHMSDYEHFCNNCFDHFYRTHKDGFKVYEPWKVHWSSSCRKEANLKLFMSEEMLPFWLQCALCDKWRNTGNDTTKMKKNICNFSCNKIDVTCVTEESEYVTSAKNPDWIRSTIALPYLKDSPATPFLKDFYYDGIGQSPPTVTEESSIKFAENMVPFYSPEDSEKARCICADVMTAEERQEFFNHLKDPSMFLALRNLVMAMWSLNPKQYLTHKLCMNSVICRGLGRITLSEELKKVLDFLTINGYINFGILPTVPKPFNLNYWKGSVLIIGGGISGAGAARQLHNAGCKVTIVEASERCGGRVKDDFSLGNCIGLGAQIITGCINNPLFIMCEQINLPLRYLGTRCDLIDDQGTSIDPTLDQEVEFRFNLILDSLEDWKQVINKQKHEKISLSEALAEQLQELQKNICKEMTPIEMNLLQFHLGNLEYGCGSSLQNVSAVHWNQNEEFPQYSGAHAWADDGFEPVIKKLVEGIKVEYNCQVVSIDTSSKKVSIETKSGMKFTADKVICAVPLTIYQSRAITFKPKLPEEKQAAIDRLGAGLIEKIALKFTKPFWRNKIGEADYFGHIPSSPKDRGLFSVFYDVSKGSNYILMTVIAGESIRIKAQLSDKELIQKCMVVLTNIFKDEIVPQPTAYVMSSWATDLNSKMAYSYVKVGSSGDDYDIVAKPVGNNLFFAGEVTNRQFPQTVTGAYLSGLREAKRILLCES
ncbi:lysine-specific histone demethylase 2 isoform X2 [Hydra vulgaris]|uniref:Lysine-specific histone demethylase 2 isoform X2 n=1 Tax=Hydra vulgaris TaxID=6087 RepID=A0ABM4BSG0_HYDVU